MEQPCLTHKVFITVLVVLEKEEEYKSANFHMTIKEEEVTEAEEVLLEDKRNEQNLPTRINSILEKKQRLSFSWSKCPLLDHLMETVEVVVEEEEEKRLEAQDKLQEEEEEESVVLMP